LDHDCELEEAAMRIYGWLLVIALVASVAAGVAADALFKGNESVPADGVVLFDGKDLSGWVQAGSDKPAGWKVESGYMEVNGAGNIATKQSFKDCQIHVEFWLPKMADATGQGRANSGVYVQGLYEIQVLDSYGLGATWGDCGGIYGVAVPLVNACRPPELWQSYDIIFHAAKFDAQGNKASSARLTLLQNGVLIHNNVEVPGPTAAGMALDPKTAGPLMLQDHGCVVRYRNIWARPI
jgi:hypothetical protein